VHHQSDLRGTDDGRTVHNKSAVQESDAVKAALIGGDASAAAKATLAGPCSDEVFIGSG
jgi:hypothetical protein